jgi:hypothetical protein
MQEYEGRPPCGRRTPKASPESGVRTVLAKGAECSPPFAVARYLQHRSTIWRRTNNDNDIQYAYNSLAWRESLVDR